MFGEVMVCFDKLWQQMSKKNGRLDKKVQCGHEELSDELAEVCLQAKFEQKTLNRA